MASQMVGLTGLQRLRPNQLAAMRARLRLLPQQLAAEQERRFHEENIAQQQAQLDFEKQAQKANQKLAKKQMKQEKRQEETAAGMQAGTLGLNLAQRGGGSITDMSRGIKSLFSGKSVEAANLAPQTATGGAGLLSNMSLGNTVGSGLVGFGTGKLLGGKNKFLKSLTGAAAGGLLGLLGGGGSAAGGSALAKSVTGGLFGGLGGLFS